MRWRVAYALGKIGSEATIPGLLKLIEDSDSDVRILVAESLGKFCLDVTISGLLKLVQDSDWYVRKSAADALGEISSDVGISELLKLIENSNHDVRKSVADALGKIGSKAGIPGCLKLVQDADDDVRSSVADALGQISSEAGIPRLLKLLQDADDDVRSSVADALGEIGSEVAIPGLLKLIEDSDSDVRGSAADELGKIGSEAAIPGLLKLVEDSDYLVPWKAANALGKIAKQHRERVAPHLPHLLTLIPSKSREKVHSLILAIQAACKYYNYPIHQLSLAPHPAKPSQPTELLAKIDETTEQIYKTTQQMSDKPTQDFSYSTFNAPFNFGDNHGYQAKSITFTAQQSSPEAALNAVVQIIQALEKKHTEVQDEEQARNIIDAEFKEIKQQKPIEWQNLITLKRVYNGGKNAAVKVGEHFAESSPWVKGFVGFLEGISEDVD